MISDDLEKLRSQVFMLKRQTESDARVRDMLGEFGKRNRMAMEWLAGELAELDVCALDKPKGQCLKGARECLDCWIEQACNMATSAVLREERQQKRREEWERRKAGLKQARAEERAGKSAGREQTCARGHGATRAKAMAPDDPRWGAE